MTLIAITSALLLFYSLLLFYFKILWDAVPESSLQPNYVPTTKVSIIVAARNEERYIGSLLDALLIQRYPPNLIELIVVDDHSTDRTAQIIQTYESVRYIYLPDYLPPHHTQAFKKMAIQVGIEHATGSLIITTDADCQPGPDWLMALVQHYELHHQIAIAAPVMFFKKNGLLNIFQELDFIAMQGITAAVLSAKLGAMCNGANFAYQKNTFTGVGGFEGIGHLASGDDMMLMNKFYHVDKSAISYLKNQAAIMQTHAMDSIPSFISQRVRWATKNKNLGDRKVQLVLLLSWAMNVALFMTMLSLFRQPDQLVMVLLLLIIKGIAEYFFMQDVARFFGRKNRWPFLFILQPLHILYMTGVGFLGMFKTYTWKKRTVK